MSRSTRRISRRAFGNPGCSSACAARIRAGIVLEIVPKSYIFQVKFSLSSGIRVRAQGCLDMVSKIHD